MPSGLRYTRGWNREEAPRRPVRVLMVSYSGWKVLVKCLFPFIDKHFRVTFLKFDTEARPVAKPGLAFFLCPS